MSAPAPPGWYVDPATGGTRWWDGASWHDPPPASGPLPFGDLPVPPPRRSRTPWIVAGIVGAVLLLAVFLFVPLLFAPPSWRDEAEQVQAALLVPAELGAGWQEIDASASAQTDPFSRALAADPSGGLAVCPDDRAEFAAFSDRLRELSESRDAAGNQIYVVLAAEQKGVRQSVVTFQDDKDASAYARTIRRWLTCAATWEVEGEGGWRFQISSEPVDAEPFGTDVIAGRLRVEAVQVGERPAGLPEAFELTQPAEITYLARHDGRSVMLIGMSGMTDDAVLEVWRTADHKMFDD